MTITLELDRGPHRDATMEAASRLGFRVTFGKGLRFSVEVDDPSEAYLLGLFTQVLVRRQKARG